MIKIYKFKGPVQRYCLYIPTSDKLQHRSTWFLKPLKTGECQAFLTISNSVIRIYKFKGQVQRYCLYIPTSDKLKHRSTWFLNDKKSYNSHETHRFRFNTVYLAHSLNIENAQEGELFKSFLENKFGGVKRCKI